MRILLLLLLIGSGFSLTYTISDDSFAQPVSSPAQKPTTTPTTPPTMTPAAVQDIRDTSIYRDNANHQDRTATAMLPVLQSDAGLVSPNEPVITPTPTSPTGTVPPTATQPPPAPPSPTALLPTATATPMPYLQGVPAPVLRGDLVMRTYSLDFYYLPGGLHPDSIKALALPVEEAIANVSTRIGGDLIGRVSIRFEPPQQGICAVRGWTISKERTIRMFYEPDANIDRIIALLSHELFHQLQHDYYGREPHLRSDTILLEGMATWGSSDYFLDANGNPRYQQEVQDALHAGTLLPLTTDLEVDCRTTTRNHIYSQWASFVEYLFLTYGREKLDQVYVNSTGRPPGSANYSLVYGKTLRELEAEWLQWIHQDS
jgi:hypothetical protein